MEFNATLFNSSSSLEPEVVISSVVVLAIAAVSGTSGNLLLLVVLAKTKQIWSIETVYVVNLALSDLFVTAVADPAAILGRYW